MNSFTIFRYVIELYFTFFRKENLSQIIMVRQITPNNCHLYYLFLSEEYFTFLSHDLQAPNNIIFILYYIIIFTFFRIENLS